MHHSAAQTPLMIFHVTLNLWLQVYAWAGASPQPQPCTPMISWPHLYHSPYPLCSSRAGFLAPPVHITCVSSSGPGHVPSSLTGMFFSRCPHGSLPYCLRCLLKCHFIRQLLSGHPTNTPSSTLLIPLFCFIIRHNTCHLLRIYLFMSLLVCFCSNEGMLHEDGGFVCFLFFSGS